MTSMVGRFSPVACTLLDEDGIVETDRGLRPGELDPADDAVRGVPKDMRRCGVEECVVVGPELLVHTGDAQRQSALEDVHGLLVGMQMTIDAAARAELDDVDLLVNRARRAVDDRPAAEAPAVRAVRVRDRGRLREPSQMVHRLLLHSIARRTAGPAYALFAPTVCSRRAAACLRCQRRRD